LQLRSAWGAATLWPGEEKELCIVKLPAGVTSLLVERGPNPKNENSAVWVTYQVRLDGWYGARSLSQQPLQQHCKATGICSIRLTKRAMCTLLVGCYSCVPIGDCCLFAHVQVGPDDLRRNALAGLLVQLAKRDAFNTLRTQQQLGYIVHMYGSTDLGVQVRLVACGGPAYGQPGQQCLSGGFCSIVCLSQATA
jgi:hypothetical protein